MNEIQIVFDNGEAARGFYDGEFVFIPEQRVFYPRQGLCLTLRK